MTAEPARTIAELVGEATAQLESLRQANPMPAAREFSMAITALEDAQMRATRGLAMVAGVFAPADLQRNGPV
jgi:hypothetical protein